MMDADEHYRRLIRMYGTAPVNDFYSPTLVVTRGAAELSFDVRPEHFHAARAVHGSVYFKALDDAAFFAANSLVQDIFVLTVSFNLYFTRPVHEGRLIAHGTVVSSFRSLIVAEAILVVGDDSRGAARGTGTVMKSRIALNEKVGYCRSRRVAPATRRRKTVRYPLTRPSPVVIVPPRKNEIVFH